MVVLEFLFAIYICVAFLAAGLIGIAVLRAGGWQELTDQANLIGRGRATFTKSKVQTLCAFIVFCWPAVPVMVSRAVKRG